MSNNKPAHEIRYGRIKAVIWKNDNPNGNGVNYSTSICRIYKDADLDQWKETPSLGRDDLLVASTLAEDAFRWIASQSKNGNG